MPAVKSFQGTKPKSVQAALRRVERRQWWLSFSGIFITLLLTMGIVSFSVSLFVLQKSDSLDQLNTHLATRGLLGMVLIFDVYVIFQQLQIHRFRMHLLEQEELFHLIGENADDMIAVVTADGKRLYNSPSYSKLLGYSLEELGKTSSYDQIHPDDRQAVISAAEETRRTGTGRRVEYRIRHKNGDWRLLESTASAVHGADGEVEKLIIVNRDITERRQLEQQLYLSQKLEAVGSLAGGIAHDFNNILGVIIGYAEAIQPKMAPDSPLREPVDEIQKAGQRAAALTQQLLAFSRKQVLEPKILHLNVVVRDVERMLHRLIGEDIELKIALASDLGRVKADRSQIEQVILNLAVNSRDAMPLGGCLTLKTANAQLNEKDSQRYSYIVPGPYILLQVSDTGHGMDAEVQSHIFEPFFTTKEQGKGTGLGLATVYGVIKQSGGYIWVESEPGKGTKFMIYLPQAEGVEEEVRQVEAPVMRAQEGCTILIVEDEASLRKLTRNTLQEVGYTVLEAENGAEALKIARQPGVCIDLLLTDVVMPGISGHKLAKTLSPELPKMRVLYMSGYTDGAVAAHGVLESGISILRKPFTRDKLTRAVEESLAAPQPEGPLDSNAQSAETSGKKSRAAEWETQDAKATPYRR